MSYLWVFVETDDMGWSRLGSHNPHERADYYNEKYYTRHFWVSEERPTEKDLEQVRGMKSDGPENYVDGFRAAGDVSR